MLNFYVGQKFGEKNVFTAVITAADAYYVSYEYTYPDGSEGNKSCISVRALNSWLVDRPAKRWYDPDRVVVVVDTID